ncbi:MAG: hypothetical protein ACE5EM_04920 [Sphingomonadales bacterium]
MILLFVRDELSYDNWLPDGDRIYRMESIFVVPGRGPMSGPQTPGPAKAALEKDFPDEIEQVVRIYQRRPTIDLGDRQFNDRLAEVDPNFFDLFDLPFVAGNKDAALGDRKLDVDQRFCLCEVQVSGRCRGHKNTDDRVRRLQRHL